MRKRNKLTPAQQLRGIRKAIRAIQRKRVSPKWLLPGMHRFAKKLQAEIREERKKVN